MPALVRSAEPDPNGLASMLIDLLRTRIDAHPSRVRLLRGPVRIRATDLGQSATIAPDGEGLVVRNRSHGVEAALVVRGDATTLLELTDLRVRLGVPVPWHRQTRLLVRALRTRALRIEGLAAHPVAAWRLTRLLAAA